MNFEIEHEGYLVKVDGDLVQFFKDGKRVYFYIMGSKRTSVGIYTDIRRCIKRLQNDEDIGNE